MSRYRTPALFVLLCAIWGTAFMATEVGLSVLPPVLFAAIRFDLAAMLLFGVLLVSDTDWRPRTREDAVYVLAGGSLIIGAHHGFLFAGQQYVTGAVAAVLLGLVPVVTPALTRIFTPEEAFDSRTAAGVVLGFAGVIVIANPDPTNFVDSILGVTLVLAAALAFALAAVLTHSRDPTLPPVATQAWMMAIGAVLLHVASFALPSESVAVVDWTLPAVGALGYLSAVAGVCGFLLYFSLLERLGPIEMSFIEYVIPLFAALAGWVVLGESVTLATVVGFGFILVGFLITKYSAIQAELARVRPANSTQTIE